MRSPLARLRRSMFLVMAALLVGLVTQGAGAQSQMQEITIKFTDAGIEAPSQARAGVTAVIVDNATGQPQGVAITRLKPGKTMEELQAAFQKGDFVAVFALLDWSGGIAAPPNSRQRAVLTLLEGMNLVVGQAEGVAPTMMQVMATSGPAPQEPMSNLSASLRDFAISMPSELRPGKQTWKIANQGPQTHELLYARIAPGKTFEDVVAAVQAEGPPSGPPPIEMESFGGLGPMSPTLNAWIEADLQPGNYVAVCFLPDQATGKPHAALGMITPFRVTAAQQPPLPATGVEAAPLMFPETGYSLSGEMLSFWQGNGALQVFGMPLNEARQANGRVTQLFERARVELHPGNAAPYNVQLGLVGVEALARQSRDWTTFPKAAANAPHYSPETGHAIAPEFVKYYRSHGLEFGDRGVSMRESIGLFGHPISPPQVETNASGDRVLTQWFERARIEYHPRNPAHSRILLGRLGAELGAGHER